METEEQKRQSDKEQAVQIALKNGMALIRRELEIWGMKVNGSTELISKSLDYDNLWSDALNKLKANNYSLKTIISIDDFKKVEIRVGTILTVEEIEGSEKLYKFAVDLGEEQTRQILGGFKLAYQKEELVGKQVLIVANLEPRKLMGLESQGMILAASNSEGKPVIVSPITPVDNGAIIR